MFPYASKETSENEIKNIVYNSIKNIKYLVINLVKDGQNFKKIAE